MSKRGRKWPKFSRLLWAVFWVLAGLLQWWDHQRSKPPTPLPPRTGQYEQLQQVQWVNDANNDGDSFKVSHSGGEQVLRLYFVDCPETRDYSLVRGRLKDQAGYFGGLSLPQTLKIGQDAKIYTERLLRERRFTVFTRWERVYDSQRVYAVVIFDDGEELSEKLTRNGLCRIHTKGTRLPDGRSEYDFESHLRQLEREARDGRRGAWGQLRHPAGG